MPLTKLQYRPGIVSDVTSYSNEGGWNNSDKIRFNKGYPQKIGGWNKYSDNTYQGTARSLHNWIALDGSNYLGIGTELKYYIEESGNFNDITPIRATTSAGDLTFDTTSGSTTVKVNDTDHGASLNDFVTISDAAASNGVPAADLNKEHQITKINSTSQYEIVVSTAATSTGTGAGGASTVGTYQLNVGLNTAVGGTGWGAGIWGGQATAAATTTMNDSGGISATDTSVTLTDASAFPSSGYINIGSEIIQYLSKSSNTLSNLNRGQFATTAAAHSDGVTVTDFTKGWGMPIGVTSLLELRTWSHDNFGEDLIINPRDGGLYYWDKTGSVSKRAVNVTSLSGATGVPTVAKQVIVSDRDRHVIAFGANADGQVDQNPLLIRFSDQEDAVDWTPTATNTAGDLLLGSGSTFMQAVETKREILIWTDASLHSMRFIGPPFTFGVELLTANTNIMGPQAAIAVEDAAFWMGVDNFYVYAGQTQQLPCTVRDHVFDDFNLDQRDKVVAGINSTWGEIWWFYPSSDSTENNRYVIYNYVEKNWYHGSLTRTAWIDRGLRDFPIAAGGSYLYNHENGVDDDGSAMTAFIESSPLDIADGDQFSFIRRLIPDVKFNGSTEPNPTLNFTLKARNFSGDDYAVSDTGATERTQTSPIQKHTQQLHLRLRGRSVVLRLESDELGATWKLGSPRIDIRPDGRR